MKLDNPQVVTMLPEWMQQQSDDKAIADAIDEVIRVLTIRARTLTRWDRLEDLSDNELNAIAWELYIPWYEQEAPHDTKVKVIQHSDLVNRRLGTKWAVESVLGDYFQSCLMREWYEYGGKPYHFKILTTNPEMANGKLAQFERLLKVTKRRSAWLDAICVCITGDCPVYVGAVQECHNVEYVHIARSWIDQYAGVYKYIRDLMEVRIGKYLTIEEMEALKEGNCEWQIS